MPVLGGKNNKFKVNPPKIRIEKVVVDRPVAKPKPRPSLNGSSSRSSSVNRPSPKPLARQKSHSPYPSSSDEKRLDRKRKAGTPSTVRRSPASDRIEFDKDSDNDDDAWMTLDANKRQRKGTADGRFVDPSRKLRSTKAFEDRVDGLDFIHAVDVASLKLKCVPVMGAQKEDVAIELQYPSLQKPEK